MSQIAYKDAESNLNELMNRAAQGEEVIIEGDDGLQVKLVVVKPVRAFPKIGSAKGHIKILEGFDDPLEEFEEYM